MLLALAHIRVIQRFMSAVLANKRIDIERYRWKLVSR